MREERKELSRYTDEALARELRLRGYEVYKWDKLPEWKDATEWSEPRKEQSLER